MPTMSDDDRSAFTLSDIRAIRWLALGLGAVAIAMTLITDRDSPLLVAGFIGVVAAVPLAAIYLLRRLRAKTAAPRRDEQDARRR